MPRERVEPGPLVVLNNALAGRLAFSDRLPSGWTHPEPADLNIKSNQRPKVTVLKTFSWSLEPSRGPGSEGYIPPSDSCHIMASVCNQNQCQGHNFDLFDVSH